MPMPWSRARRGVSRSSFLPSQSTSPESGRVIPASTFMRVDLPAPFSPTRACDSPRAIGKLTPRSARTAPKDFLTSLNSKPGVDTRIGTLAFRGPRFNLRGRRTGPWLDLQLRLPAPLLAQGLETAQAWRERLLGASAGRPETRYHPGPAMGTTERYRADAITTFATTLLARAGLPDDKARTVAEILVEADLLGHTTHGLDMLARY